jgi:hypothetical protein
MSKAVVYQGQSFLDKIVECTGDIDNAFEMMLLNSISITEELHLGRVLKKSKITDYEIVACFTEMNKPATKKIVTTNNLIDYSFPGEFPFSF